MDTYLNGKCGETVADIADPCNDADFIEALYLKNRAFLFQKAGSYTQSPDVREDIIQETVLRLIRNVDKLRILSPTALLCYLSLTVRSAALNYFKLETRDSLNALPLSESEETCDVWNERCRVQFSLEEQILMGQRDKEIHAAISRLSDRDQLLLKGKYFMELDNHELANLMGVSRGNLRVLLHRVRERVKKELMKEGVLYG